MLAGAVNVALLAGEVIDTVGGWFAALTVTLTAADVVFNPARHRPSPSASTGPPAPTTT